jgi:TetR/AcrR family transcriptional repressor of lmrAB and yxaGH operons
MAHRTISEGDLLGKALGLFRVTGFEGVSMSDLSQATGLEKASLYYRYSGGKEEIAVAAMEYALAGLEEGIFAPLRTDLPPRERVLIVVENLRAFYADGTLPCVIELLSLPNGGARLTALVRTALQAWLTAFAGIASESGFSADEAHLRAEDALLGIEGSLVLSRVLKDPSAFQRVLRGLPDLLTGSAS